MWLFRAAAPIAPFKAFAAAFLVVASATIFAGEPADPADIARVRNALADLAPNLKPDSINATPLPGLFEVMLGTQALYVSKDGRYALDGSLFDLKTRENLSERRVAAARLRAIESVGEDEMLIYGPEDAPYTVTVFTDPDCGYCRKFHSEMDRLNQLGIRVRYLLYPRAGVGSPSYDKAVSAWCADDPHAALTAAKQGKAIPEKTCPNPVKKHLALGHSLGVQGTPSLILENGEMLPGYLPADRLKAELEHRRAVAAKQGRS